MNVILNLTIRRKWFDMIASGEKREEYRSMNNAQVWNAYERIQCNPCSFAMILRNGYRMDSPAVVVRITDILPMVEAFRPEWGEPNYPHQIISFDKILARGTYAEVKKALEEGKVRDMASDDINKEMKAEAYDTDASSTTRKSSVDHPQHYRSGGMEAIDVIEAFGLGFNLVNVAKYILRAGRKADALEDLMKARWYLNREITRMENAARVDGERKLDV